MVYSNTEKSLSLVAYKKIKKMVLHHEIDTTRALSDLSVAKLINSSRTPVREAFIMLEGEGFLTRSEAGRFYVRTFSLKDINDLYEFRAFLEGAVASMMVERVSEDVLQTLESIIYDSQALLGKEPETVLAKGMEFHMTATEITGNSYLINTLKHCYEIFELISWAKDKKGMNLCSHEDHCEILEALRSKNADALKRSIDKHCKTVRDWMIQLLIDDKENLYFSPDVRARRV